MGDPIDYARLAASPFGGTTDAGRLRFLVKHLSLTSVDDVLALCAEVVARLLGRLATARSRQSGDA